MQNRNTKTRVKIDIGTKGIIRRKGREKIQCPPVRMENVMMLNNRTE